MVQKSLTHLLEKTPAIKITDSSRYVIFSDLHMGNKRRRDDFKKNSFMFYQILQQYYLTKNYTLILNGDVEELLKFSLHKIMLRWRTLYALFSQFQEKRALYKIVGNHDYFLPIINDYPFRDVMSDAIKLLYKTHTLFIFHGHQASSMIEKYNSIFGILLRYIAKPLGVKNNSTAYNSRRKYRVEKLVYEFATKQHLVCIIGHTHRPLFESLSKEDSLKYRIEQLVQLYPETTRQTEIQQEINAVKKELQWLKRERPKDRHSLYNTAFVTPVLFNSGSVIGRRGISAIEIKDGFIKLVYWFNKSKRQKRLDIFQEGPFNLENTDCYKFVLKKDRLDYVFTKIKLLA